MWYSANHYQARLIDKSQTNKAVTSALYIASLIVALWIMTLIDTIVFVISHYEFMLSTFWLVVFMAITFVVFKILGTVYLTHSRYEGLKLSTPFAFSQSLGIWLTFLLLLLSIAVLLFFEIRLLK